MEPTDLYNRSKRTLVLFAALLAMVLFGGVEATKETQVWGFKIRPEVLPTVLFFVVIYLLYQFFLASVFQVDEIRKRTRLDFAITTGIASLVLVGYLVFYLFHQVLGLAPSVLMNALPVAAAVLAAVFYLIKGSEWIKWRREAIELREATIEKRLKESGWILNFNPKVQNGTKEISFNDDGSIGHGRNDNEYSWRLVNNRLEILSVNGEIQNVFEYDASTNQFKSNRPARAFNIEGQYIFRETN